jgi:hypothetical protein
VLALQPVSATAVGYHHTDARTGVTLGLDELLDDYSAAGLRDRRAVTGGLRQQLGRFSLTSLDPQERIDLLLMRNARLKPRSHYPASCVFVENSRNARVGLPQL